MLILCLCCTIVDAEDVLPEKPPGEFFPLRQAVHKGTDSFKQGQPIVGTTYFYWYDIDSKSHIIDGDGTDDLLGIWPSQVGVWVKYSSSSTWEVLSSTANWIACGKMRTEGIASPGVFSLSVPAEGLADGPNPFEKFKDLTSEGPGG